MQCQLLPDAAAVEGDVAAGFHSKNDLSLEATQTGTSLQPTVLTRCQM